MWNYSRLSPLAVGRKNVELLTMWEGRKNVELHNSPTGSRQEECGTTHNSPTGSRQVELRMAGRMWNYSQLSPLGVGRKNVELHTTPHWE